MVRIRNYSILLRAYRLMKSRKRPVLAKDVSLNTIDSRRALDILVILNVAKRVHVIYYTGRKRQIKKEIKGYMLK